MPDDDKPKRYRAGAVDTSHLDDQIRSLHDKIEELHSKDHEERQAMQRRIDELEEERKERIEKAKHEEEAKSDKNTLVVPPHDIPPAQPAPPPNPPELEESGTRRGWKHAWHGFIEDYS